MTDPRPFRIRDFLAPLGAVALALLLGVLVAPTRSAGRVANLDVTHSRLPEAYLMHHRTEPHMGYLVDRRSSTMRRDRAGQAGRKRRIERVPSGLTDVRDTWLLRSRLLGTVLLVPVEALRDWSTPYVHAWLRQQFPRAALPEVFWVQLHVDRVYQGVYLKASLPVDKRKKEGGTGALRVVLETDGETTSRINTRFEDGPGVYMAGLATGVFSMPLLPHPSVIWLMGMYGLPTTTLIVAKEAPYDVSALPFPVALAPIFQRARGRSPAHVQDRRAMRWRQTLAPPQYVPFNAAQLAELQGGWPAWLAALVQGLVLDRKARDLPPLTAVEIAAHLGAMDGLGLKAGGT